MIDRRFFLKSSGLALVGGTLLPNVFVKMANAATTKGNKTLVAILQRGRGGDDEHQPVRYPWRRERQRRIRIDVCRGCGRDDGWDGKGIVRGCAHSQERRSAEIAAGKRRGLSERRARQLAAPDRATHQVERRTRSRLRRRQRLGYARR